jgi:hypothetical protein
MPSVSVVMPVLHNERWQKMLTRAALDTMRVTTDLKFQSIIVEAGTCCFGRYGSADEPNDCYNSTQPGGRLPTDDVWITLERPGGPVVDANEGFRVAAGDLIVYISNDIFVRPGWLEALLECYARFPDCGVATLASSDLKHRPDPGRISEGVYGPFMMFPRGWEFDAESFPTAFADTDLITRIYRTGKRSYRNWSVVISHQPHTTVRDAVVADGEEASRRFHEQRQRYAQKHYGCGLLVYELLVQGHVF